MKLESLDYKTIDSRVTNSETATLGFNETEQVYRIRIEDTVSNKIEDFYSRPTSREKRTAKIIGGLAGLFAGCMISGMIYKFSPEPNYIFMVISPIAGTLLGVLFGATKGAKMKNKREFQEELQRHDLAIR